ncbi:hypothetical protein ACFL2D_00135 [Patescibacteria group bacterium]
MAQKTLSRLSFIFKRILVVVLSAHVGAAAGHVIGRIMAWTAETTWASGTGMPTFIYWWLAVPIFFLIVIGSWQYFIQNKTLDELLE